MNAPKRISNKKQIEQPTNGDSSRQNEKNSNHKAFDSDDKNKIQVTLYLHVFKFYNLFI